MYPETVPLNGTIVAGCCRSGCRDKHCRKAGEEKRDQNSCCWFELNVSIFHNLISFSCFGFVAVVPGNPETQTVSHSFPKLCAALQREFGTDAAYRAAAMFGLVVETNHPMAVLGSFRRRLPSEWRLLRHASHLDDARCDAETSSGHA